MTLQPDRAYFSQLPFESIDMATGNLVLSFTDVVLGGNGGMHIGIVRTMNHGAAGGPAWAIGPAGIPIAIEGMDPPATGPWVVGVVTGDRGRRQVLHQTGVDTYVLDNFMRVTLSTRTVELPNGWVATFETTSGVREAQLQEVHDAFGNSIVATWLPRPQGVLTTTNISQLELRGGGDAPRQVFFTYDTAGVQLQLLQSEGRTWTYSYSAGQLTSATPPAGPAWQYSYGASDFSVTTPNGGVVAYQFQQLADSQGHTHPAVSSRSIGGRDVPSGIWTFEYYRHLSPMMSIVNSPDGRHLGYRHQETANPTGSTYWTLVSKTLHRGLTLLANVNITHVPCGDGFTPMVQDRTLTQEGRTYVTSFQYNNLATQRCDFHRAKQITQSGDLTRITTHTFAYPAQVYRGDLIASATVSSGGQSLTTSYTYNTQAFLTSESTLGIQTLYAPDAAGNVGSLTNANNQTSSFTYQWGTLKNTQTPLYTIARTINSTGSVASETRRGIQTTLSYDALGRLTTVNAPGVDATTTVYNADSMVVTQGATVITTEIDGFGRTRRVLNNVGVSSTTQYDAEGRVVSQTYPSDGTATGNDSFGYDDFGRVTSVSHNAGGSITTSYTGTTATVTDENGRTTTQTFARFGPGDGRLTSVLDPAGQTWQYSYNGLGALTTVAQPGGTTRTFAYDPWNRLLSETHPESGTTTYTYNDIGSVTSKQDARGTVFGYTYDANNRLTAITGLGSDSVTMTYDDSDNRRTVTNGAVNSVFDYDNANRLTTRADTINGAAFTTSYLYDGRSNLTRLSYPSGRIVNYSYDAGNRVTQIADGGGQTYASGLAYHPGGALKSLTFGNSTTESATFDGRYRLSQLTSGPLGLTYAYDPGGNVTSISDTRPSFSSSFTYDALDRLRVVTGWGASEFQYDALGNRLWEANGNVTSTYSSTTLRLTQTSGTFGSASYTYDNGGNLQAAGADTFQYSPFNMLRTATVNGVQTSYTYNGDNERVIRTGPEGVTYTIRGPGSQVLAEYDVAGSTAVLVREYVLLGSKLIASIGRPPGALPMASVTLTSPTAGSTFTTGTAITFMAQATVTSGSIARVEFYANGIYLGEDTVAPYSLTRNDLGQGPNGLVARVVTASGVAASSANVLITIVPPNGAPTVSLTSPANNAVLGTGRTANLTATASDDGSIQRVEFYRGTFLLATDTTAPYSYAWTDLPNGVYTLTAKAYDFTGLSTTSTAVTLTVRPIATITVNPASPTAGVTASVTVDGAAFCTAVNVDFGDGNVETFVNGGGLPITGSHYWATSGPKTLTATGLGGACDSQASTTITVLIPPSVSLTSPTSGTTYFSPATIEFAATASPGQGSIAYVAFYANWNYLGTDFVAPFTYTWSGVGNGSYSLNAMAWDTFGALAASSSVAVTVGDASPSTVTGVTVTPNPVVAGQSATVTVTGTNPCTMLEMHFGDGDWWIAPIGGLPFTTTKVWAAPGTYTVTASGYYQCYGSATRVVTVTAGTPEPEFATSVDLGLAAANRWFTNSVVSNEAESVTDLPATDLGDATDVTPPEPPAPLGDTLSPDVTIFVDINGTGSGSVTGAAACSGLQVTCPVVATAGTVISFTAAPHTNMIFTGWTGSCTGTNPTCQVYVQAHTLVVANFAAPPAAMVTTYYHADALGSVRALSDSAGATVERHDYRPFGEDTMPLPPPGSDPSRFLGQQRDSTKLDQFGARYYSMFHGRFTTVDPVISPSAMVRPQKWNRYAYAQNNPLRFVDPTGLDDDEPPPVADEIPPCSIYCQGFNAWAEELWKQWELENLFSDQQGRGGSGSPGLTVGQVQQQLNLILGLDAGHDVFSLAQMAYSEATVATLDQYSAMISVVFNRINTPEGYGANGTVQSILRAPNQFQGVDSAEACAKNSGCTYMSNANNPTNQFIESAFMAALAVYNFGQPMPTTTATAFLSVPSTRSPRRAEVAGLGRVDRTPTGVLEGLAAKRRSAIVYLYNYQPRKGR